jgi:glucose-6-phosphate-specific signal transduction histidine kinase
MESLSEAVGQTRREIAISFLKTTAFSLAIGVTIWLLGWAAPLWGALVVSLSIGYSVNTASLVLQPFFLRWLPPFLAIVPTTLIGVGFGIALGSLLATGNPLYLLADGDYSTPILGLFFGVLGLLFFTAQQRLKDIRAELADARAAELSREKSHLETQLRLLQAQIEPHFLFNTLSNVVGMIRDQPEAAEATLLNLTTLLRASLQRTREDTIRLTDEVELIEALLRINRIRMGDRLTWQIDVDESVAEFPMPPMLLQPLVENAVKHGIEPLEEGGKISLTARAEDQHLIVTISDTGQGLTGEPSSDGSGVGIANVQSRLAALFGADASLSLHENDPDGMIVVMSLPFQTS